MYKFFFKFLRRKFFYNLYLRRFILVFFDAILIFASIKLSEYFTTYINKPLVFDTSLSFKLITIFFGLFFNFITGQYKSITKYISYKAIYAYTIRNFIFSILLYLFFKESFEELTLFFCLIYFISLTYTTLIVRFVLRDLSIFLTKFRSLNNFQRIVIYGAGSAGVQLAATLRLNHNYNLAYFVDDSQLMWGRNINGIKVKAPSYLKEINQKIDKILFAIPSIDSSNKRRIFNFLGDLNKPVLQIPSIDEILYKNFSIDTLKPIGVEEILGRLPVKPDKILIERNIKNKSVLVTGAAGSIGSELCRQILKFNPKKLILIDQSEYNLYVLQNEFKQIYEEFTELKFFLGNVLNQKLIENIIKENKINLILHAAAYKHVPLLESNIFQGLLNNVLSTKIICETAYKNDVEKVILISSDKAVRPTNIMGASKRISELLIQAYAKFSKENKNKIIYSMVRFGNVLGSSGSVVPLFKKQIAKGGPITITDVNVIRYFMTIKEASQLVLQSTSLAKGGDLFLLDMGNPIKIIDLARKMIFLSGLSVKDKLNPNGDIEIKVIGLRPGEKLYEELLIDSESRPTKHPLIYTAKEKMLDIKIIQRQLDKLEKHAHNNEMVGFIKTLKKLVPEYKGN
tara:strand:+ start:84 stop:1964 length:1881 start_codon:yes stop_codon:yes gene_type:complete